MLETPRVMLFSPVFRNFVTSTLYGGQRRTPADSPLTVISTVSRTSSRYRTARFPAYSFGTMNVVWKLTVPL